MKRKELEKLLKKAGFVFVRHGGRHDVFQRGKDEEQLPRHTEINEMLAKSIIKKWNLK
jgi:mRNA interferase HicA